MANTRPRFTRRHFLAAVGAATAAQAVGLPRMPVARAASAIPAGFTVHDDLPNAEPAVAHLIDTWMTPTDKVYIRNHAHSPEVDFVSHRVRVVGDVERELELSLADLAQDFTQVKHVATLQCAGNRRAELNDIKQVGGVPWGPGAIGNVEWTGAPLAAILAKAGLKDSAKHIQFEGADEVHHAGEVFGFGGSVPVEKALAPECLLAYAMNGERLTTDHGHPLRAMIPGYLGARSVKWLKTIRVSAETSPNHFHAGAYKIFPPNIDASTADWAAAEPLGELPVNSYIASVAIEGGAIVARGWAFAGGAKDARLKAVEISPDGGKTWRDASIVTLNLPYCWVLWEARFPKGTKTLTACATNTEGEMQPQDMAALWNFKGYGNNAWHTVKVG